jgi:hypothetical protein
VNAKTTDLLISALFLHATPQGSIECEHKFNSLTKHQQTITEPAIQSENFEDAAFSPFGQINLVAYTSNKVFAITEGMFYLHLLAND